MPSVVLLGWLVLLLAPGALALPPADADPAALQQVGVPVSRIPTADSVQAFLPLGDEYALLSLKPARRYLLTLSGHCIGMRYARHVGVTASNNTIWAGFDALTADGSACPIRAIHRLPAETGSGGGISWEGSGSDN